MTSSAETKLEVKAVTAAPQYKWQFGLPAPSRYDGDQRRDIPRIRLERDRYTLHLKTEHLGFSSDRKSVVSELILWVHMPLPGVDPVEHYAALDVEEIDGVRVDGKEIDYYPSDGRDGDESIGSLIAKYNDVCVDLVSSGKYVYIRSCMTAGAETLSVVQLSVYKTTHYSPVGESAEERMRLANEATHALVTLADATVAGAVAK